MTAALPSKSPTCSNRSMRTSSKSRSTVGVVCEPMVYIRRSQFTTGDPLSTWRDDGFRVPGADRHPTDIPRLDPGAKPTMASNPSSPVASGLGAQDAQRLSMGDGAAALVVRHIALRKVGVMTGWEYSEVEWTP